jgi:hypothetical protein
MQQDITMKQATIEELQAIGDAINMEKQKRFYHNSRCKFEEPNTHKTAFVNKANCAFNIAEKGKADIHELQSLVAKLIEGQDFFLNEYLQRVEHKVYIDIDMPIDEACVTAITEFIKDLIDGDPQVMVLKNNISGKIHMVLNVSVHNLYDDTHHAILRYLRDYLYSAVEHEISHEDWNNNFDCTAKGLRLAYSVKMDGVKVAR